MQNKTRLSIRKFKFKFPAKTVITTCLLLVLTVNTTHALVLQVAPHCGCYSRQRLTFDQTSFLCLQVLHWTPLISPDYDSFQTSVCSPLYKRSSSRGTVLTWVTSQGKVGSCACIRVLIKLDQIDTVRLPSLSLRATNLSRKVGSRYKSQI